MNGLFSVLWLIAVLVLVVFLFKGILKLKIGEKAGKNFKISGIAFVLSIVFLVLCGVTSPDKDETSTKELEQKKEDTAIIENDDVIAEKTAESDEQDVDEETNSDLPVIYDKNEGINTYIKAFNAANPETPITSDMAQPYHHHGVEHKDQIKYYADGFEVVITRGDNIYIGYTPKTSHTDDEYKQMYIKYVKGLDLGLSDEQIEADWNALIEDLTHRVKFDDYEGSIIRGTLDRIDYITIEKNFIH